MSEFVITTAKNGSPAIEPIIINNERILIHSIYNPEREAERLIAKIDISDKKIIMILGLGLGYHITELLKKNTADKKIIIVESKRGIFELFQKYADDSLKKKELDICVNPDEQELMTVFSNNITFKNFLSIKIIEHENSIKLAPEYYHFVLATLRKYINFTQTNLTTTARFGKEWILNSIKNLEYYCRGYDIKILKEYCADKPALIISAGPSLDNSIDIIKKHKTHFRIFCVDTALKTLIANDIKPDFVCAVDSQKINFELLNNIDVSDICLVTTLIVHPEIPKKFKHCFFFSAKTPVDLFLKNTGYQTSFVKSGGSVATSLFSVLREIQCNPIVFTGQDLALTNNLSHTRFSNKYSDLLKSLNKFFTFETMFFNEISDYIIVDDIRGNKIMTTQTLLNYCKWFELEFSDKKTRYINVSNAGILKKNIELMDFKKLIETVCARQLEKFKFNCAAHNQLITDNAFKRLKKIIISDLQNLKNMGTAILYSKDFSKYNELLSYPFQYDLFEYENNKDNIKIIEKKILGFIDELTGAIN